MSALEMFVFGLSCGSTALLVDRLAARVQRKREDEARIRRVQEALSASEDEAYLRIKDFVRRRRM